MKLSIIIPVYNEEERLAPTFKDLVSFMDKQNYFWEVVFVNDGSKDGTVELIKKLSRGRNNIRLINNKENQGKGAVVKQGMLAGKGDWLLFMDADNSTKIEEINKFWSYTNSFEVLIGSRYIKGSKILSKQPVSRRILSRMGNILVQLLLTPGIKDTQCGFKLFSKNATEKIFPKIKVKKWSLDLEIMAICKSNGIKIKEIPSIWKEGPGSKLKVAKTATRTFSDLFKIKFKQIKGCYKYDKIC
jgi:dolichyl-phosphate beta-glucosyltransferase